MGTLTVWKFPNAEGAEMALDTLKSLEKQGLIDVYDGAVVSWPAGTKKPKTRQMHSTAGSGALGGSFWGFLFGLIFFVPLLGMAIGAATGALAGSLSDVGIDDEFIKNVRSEVTPGTSALFVMTGNAVMDKVHDAFGGQQPTLIFTNLSEEQDKALRGAFADA
ncbi:DUF1269 domain-containing protein [Jatrophihabitans sp. DSM 45814]